MTKRIVKRRRDGVIQRYNVVPKSIQNRIVKERLNLMARELKKSGRVRVPEIGILRIKTKRATKGGKKIMMFGKEVISKAKPKRRLIKFRATKSLKDIIK
tara:strand:+ start:3591 stop:3890 length:300 start_codon:yes stop_codon:yes gene_type:complete